MSAGRLVWNVTAYVASCGQELCPARIPLISVEVTDETRPE